MSTKITRDVLEAYLACKTKGHLRQLGEHGTPSPYEVLLTGRRDEVRLRVLDCILTQHSADEVARNVPLTAAALKRGPLYVLDPTFEDGTVCLNYDGLKRVDGPSKLGDFHYVPVLFGAGEHVGKEQRLLLEVYAVLLSRVQGRTPAYGVVWKGRECRATKIRLSTEPRKAERVLRELQEAGPPKLVLNDHCQVCEFRQRCHEQAMREDNLSLLRSMGEKEIRSCGRKGILTVTQLAHTFRPRRKGKRVVRRTYKRYHALQALAIRDKRLYIFGTPELPERSVSIYLDIEGIPDEGFVYLIGLIVVQGGAEERHSFWADSKDQEQQVFEQLLEVVGRYDDYRIFCYGSYERNFIKRMRKSARKKKPVDRVLDRLVNVLSVIHAHLYFPCYSNGLKDVGGWLGCSWTDPDASGIQSLVWRANWETRQEDQWKQKLLAYNLEDCAALRKVTEQVYALASRAPGTAGRIESPAVAWVLELDRSANPRKWGKVNFVHGEFEQINNCGYFDYQRERVFVRTDRKLRRRQRKRKQSPNMRLRVTRRVVIVASHCPKCKGSDVVSGVTGDIRTPRPRVKRAFDLVFTRGGIRRQVIECRTSVHRCRQCGEEFVPYQHQRLDMHFQGLKSWAVYQHVAHALSMQTISTMLEEFFQLRLAGSILHSVKALMARQYRSTYRRLLNKILAGPLLHIDETEVKLQSGKGYVWVFASLGEVVYLYRPTREGDFLKDLLKDFRGVLVSDFYAAYDGLECPQQKCLIHLIRDMNQELLDHPYDEELRSVTQPFGVLLRDAVATVDEHGLKARHLKQHARQVSRYFRELAARTFRSEAAEALQQRLLKYQGKLFTFIQYDGVPWNNNSAENAIKRFAYYRELTVGVMREPGLKAYLILLSVCQTCRYKEVSFLKFLLSRERDVDAFCQGKHRRRRTPLDLYPVGYVPAYRLSLQKAAAKKQAEKSESAQEQGSRQAGRLAEGG
jgi:predicted RecB family nuclease